ncbi:MAG: methyl-accepting chemotaxis protein [Proteobacteria bacterium]|nr:methyl-accepting chemotaxis protein [Pseudomonadota bacterium]
MAIQTNNIAESGDKYGVAMILRSYWAFVNFFSPYDSSGLNHQTLQRIRIAVSFSLIGTIFVIINGFQWLQFKSSQLAVMDFGTAVAFLVLLMLFKVRVLSLNMYGNAIMLFLAVNTYITIFSTGGARSDELFWLLLFPVFAQLLISGRGGLVWFLIIAIGLAVLFYLHWTGYSFPQIGSHSAQDKKLGWTITVFGGFTSFFVASALFQNAIGASMNELTTTKDSAEVVSQNLKQILSQIKTNSITLNESSTGLADTSTKLEENANMTFDKTVNVYKSSQDIKNKVDVVTQEIKVATDRMQSIADITRQAQKIVEEGNSIAGETSRSMSKLKKSGEDSVIITNMIQQTSKQLKLLSLNAAIEAANAGEHGEGFAIVANQVKNLAERTSAATENVSEINKSIQYTTEESATYLEKLVDIIQSISDFQDKISTSTSAQLSATKTISKNLSETADISSVITESINEVVAAAESNKNEVQKTHGEAESLATMSKSLSRLLETDKEKQLVEEVA